MSGFFGRKGKIKITNSKVERLGIGKPCKDCMAIYGRQRMTANAGEICTPCLDCAQKVKERFDARR